MIVNMGKGIYKLSKKEKLGERKEGGGGKVPQSRYRGGCEQFGRLLPTPAGIEHSINHSHINVSIELIGGSEQQQQQSKKRK